jgi:hypothetical protein
MFGEWAYTLSVVTMSVRSDVILLGVKGLIWHRRRRGGGRGVRTTPFGKKSLKLTVKFRSPEFFFKIYRENLEFLTKRPTSANPGYAYVWCEYDVDLISRFGAVKRKILVDSFTLNLVKWYALVPLLVKVIVLTNPTPCFPQSALIVKLSTLEEKKIKSWLVT